MWGIFGVGDEFVCERFGYRVPDSVPDTSNSSQLFADQSRHNCAWACVLYQKQRDSGHGHHAALRAVGHRRVKILPAMQRTGSRYDEAVYVAAQRRHSLKCPPLKGAY